MARPRFGAHRWPVGICFQAPTAAVSFKSLDMEYGAIAIAALGLVTGLMFRLKVLLGAVGLLLVASVVFAVVTQSTFSGTAFIILVTQAILQGSYFLGVTISVLLANSRGSSRVL